MLSNIKKLLSIFVIVIAMVACENNTTAPSVDADIDPSLYPIELGQIDSQSGLYVKIPIELFGGSESDLVGASVDVLVNGSTLANNVVVESLFDTDEQVVVFYMSPVANESTLGFTVTSNVGGETFFEGIASNEESTLANLSAIDPSISTGQTVAEFFDEKISSEGDATGTDINGTYTVTFAALTLSDGCESDFMTEMDYFADGEIAEQTVSIVQYENQLQWDVQDETIVDIVGILNANDSFELFDGDYVDENNYNYVLYSGTFTEDGSITGTLESQMVLDGTRLSNGLAGTCTVSTTFSGVNDDLNYTQ